MTWSDEATEIIEELLHEIPAPVREAVQDSASTQAEALTSEAGEDEVSMETAVRAFIESTPSELRQRLKHTLTYHGIDPEEYAAAFSRSACYPKRESGPPLKRTALGRAGPRKWTATMVGAPRC